MKLIAKNLKHVNSKYYYLIKKHIILFINFKVNDNQDEFFHDIKGQIKVKLKYKDNRFYVNCLQCRNLVTIY